jgi:NO-binding membrane sensor protein with MHYT domain
MDQPDRDGGRVEGLRRWLLWVLVLGLAGTASELLLLEHYEEPWQFVPLVLVALAFLALAWYTRGPDTRSRRTLQALMVLFLLAGFAGLALHFRGAAEFQLETNPDIGKWELVKKVMRAKAPPVLAPGVMLQLGLIGLALTFTDSRNGRSEQP